MLQRAIFLLSKGFLRQSDFPEPDIFMQYNSFVLWFSIRTFAATKTEIGKKI